RTCRSPARAECAGPAARRSAAARSTWFATTPSKTPRWPRTSSSPARRSPSATRSRSTTTPDPPTIPSPHHFTATNHARGIHPGRTAHSPRPLRRCSGRSAPRRPRRHDAAGRRPGFATAAGAPMSAGESAPNRGDDSAPNGGATSASADGTSPLLIERLPDRTVIRLNRPEVRNAIDESMSEALRPVCAELEAERKIAILTGTSGVFAAGADIGQLRDRCRDDALAGINSKIFTRIQQLPMPVIALVEGFALGGGAELAFAADFRIGTPSTRIGNPEAGLGILAAAGAAWRLRELVGEPRAKEILLAGRTLQADEAKAIGLLNDVVDPEDLETAGQALAERIASFAPLAVRLSKSAFHAPREAHPLIDNVAQAVLFETQEKFARMDAFLSKREAKKAK